MTRREAVRLLAPASIGFSLCSSPAGLAAGENDATPPLAPGAPKSPERLALIKVFKKQSEGLQNKFEPRTLKSEWKMPYRLFRPETKERAPLVVYLSGSGGLGNDNLKQLGFGNIFGTRVWLLPANQKRFPCYVLAPQTDRGWARYDMTAGGGRAQLLPGLGDGTKLALEVVDAVSHEFAIDEKRIYILGQSMGGAGVWNALAFRPRFFGASVICCGGEGLDDSTASLDTPLWNFHGDADDTVPVSVSRDRIAARRTAGGQPLYTEYAGVGHDVYEWAFTEPSLVTWLFSQRRG